MTDIFISYARSTAAQAKRVADALRGLGYAVWWDDDMPAHGAFADMIEQRLVAAKAVVVVWSPEAVKSQWVRSEANRARLDGKLVQLSLDGGELPMPFDQIQCARLPGWTGDPSDHEWLKVVASVASLAGEPGGGAAAAPVLGPTRLVDRGVRAARSPFGMAVLGLLIVGVGGWLALGALGWPGRAGAGVAIIPLQSPANDPVAQTLADGVAEEVASALVKTDLKFLPQTGDSGGPSEAPDAAAIRLGAALTLGGHVQRAGDTLTVTMFISDPRRHEVLWSSTYSGAAKTAQDLKEQVAADVGEMLHCSLDASSAQGPRIGPDSERLYLRACEASTADSSEKTRDLYRLVTAREPKFTGAWTNFALFSALAADELPPDQKAAAKSEAKAAAEKALQLDPKSGDAYVALVTLLPDTDHFWERQTILLKGLAAAPDTARLNHREADLLGQVGRYNESVQFERRAVVLDPLNEYLNESLIGVISAGGRLAESRALLSRAQRTWPANDGLRVVRIGFEARIGDPALALKLLDDPATRPTEWEGPTVEKWRRFIKVRQSADPAARAAYAREILANLKAGRTEVNHAMRDLVTAGATDAAFEAAMFSGPQDVLDPEVLFRAAAEPMRRDPRFMPLAARLGLVDFWERSGKWPDYCEAPDRPYDCRAVAKGLRR
jgi:TolB-like protein/tetratricopeptide (TPR) repeat protein